MAVAAPSGPIHPSEPVIEDQRPPSPDITQQLNHLKYSSSQTVSEDIDLEQLKSYQTAVAP